MPDKENKPVIDADEMSEDEEDPIDDEQLDEYRELVEQLGTFPVSGKSRGPHVQMRIFYCFLTCLSSQ
jgi:hypothetical protein